MSLKDLKNTLKACTSSTSSSLSLSGSQDAHQWEQRKPPKSSIKQQLAGLERLAADVDRHTEPSAVSEPQQNGGDVPSSKPVAKKRWTFSGRDDTALAESWEHQKQSKDDEEVADSEAGVFVQPHTEGPFEPLLLSSPDHDSQIVQVSNHLELVKPNPKDDPEKQKKDEALAVAIFQNDAGLIGGTTQDESFMSLSDAQHCGKMRALAKLMASWISQGDKVLLFSYSVRMLDILEKFLIRKGYSFSRLDGSTPMSSRQSLLDDFNNSPSKQVFLISTRAGGLGLNLASANRVVIFDPNWNPAQDLQAQDRSFRYGQKRHVTVFRLLAAGSLEELVYTRQIYKQQLFNIAVSGNLEKRYFEGVQDSKEFKGELFGICNLFQDLSDKVFTSDIVELHEERMQGFRYHVATGNGEVTVSAPSVGQNMGMSENALNSIVTEQLEATPAISGKNVFISKAKHKDNLPKLADILSDAGVIYVHRNEDVVNFGVRNLDGCAEDGDELKPHKSGGRHLRKMGSKKPSMANEKTKESKKPVVSRKVEGTTDKKLDKTKQYSKLAQFKGMSDLEFSKWLLSASPSERDNLLGDYKKWIKNSKD